MTSKIGSSRLDSKKSKDLVCKITDDLPNVIQIKTEDLMMKSKQPLLINFITEEQVPEKPATIYKNCYDKWTISQLLPQMALVFDS